MAEETKQDPKPQPKPEPKPAAVEAVAVQTRTPAEWAEKLGLIQKRNPLVPQSVDNPHHTYAAADSLYGWTAHAYHYQGEGDRFELTEDDFKKAIAAAMAYPTVAPHAAALPKSRAEAFQNFVPRKSRKAPEAS